MEKQTLVGEAEGIEGQCHKELEHLHIFVNSRRFDKAHGVKLDMTVADIANLAKISPEVAVVRRYHGKHYSEPMHGDIEIVSGDHFVVTRKKVDGGSGAADRVDTELQRIAEGGGEARRLPHPENAVIYLGLPVLGRPELGQVDVLVQIPPGYPAQMIDYAFLPSDSPLVGRVKGSPQDVITCGGRQWRRISYHPHGNGGAGPWNPQGHGFDTYLAEILSWLGDSK
jgi:hypothetical protein